MKAFETILPSQNSNMLEFFKALWQQLHDIRQLCRHLAVSYYDPEQERLQAQRQRKKIG